MTSSLFSYPLVSLSASIYDRASATCISATYNHGCNSTRITSAAPTLYSLWPPRPAVYISATLVFVAPFWQSRRGILELLLSAHTLPLNKVQVNFTLLSSQIRKYFHMYMEYLQYNFTLIISIIAAISWHWSWVSGISGTPSLHP